MRLPETSAELSAELSGFLIAKGEYLLDRVEFKIQHPTLGQIKLNDYWSGFHIAHAGSRHNKNPKSFLDEGHIPVLGLHQESPQLSVFVFRPCDISLRGMGTILIRELPEEVQLSEHVITTKDYAALQEPLKDYDLERMLAVL